MSLKQRYPSLDYLKHRAKQRIPRFAWEYMTGGCNQDLAVRHNRVALDRVHLRPDYLASYQTPDLHTSLFNQTYDIPIGIAPLGLTGLIWPEASLMHARVSKQKNIPFVLSTVSTISIEQAAQAAQENFWFQLYPPSDQRIRHDLMQRAWDVGCRHLVVTIDVPTAGQRPRDTRNGLSVPPKISLGNILQSAMRPTWSITTLRHGLPQFASLQPYIKAGGNMQDHAHFVRHTLRDVVDDTLIQQIREHWQGKLIIKGICHVEDAKRALTLGADGIIVSNHGGRQLDAAQATIEVLPDISAAVGKQMLVMADSGVESGVDIARFLSAGARMVFAGRAFLYGVAAQKQDGAAHVVDLLTQELEQVMTQLHCAAIRNMTEHRISK